MKSIIRNDTIQIEITNVCLHNCSNCTRFCGHVKNPFYMDIDTFKLAVDSMKGFPNMVGMQGGEPLLHPKFSEFCAILRDNFPKNQLGLWTTLPIGKEHYRTDIVDTFGHIFINDHTRNDIFHHPCLVAIEEVVPDKNLMWHLIDKCWAQEGWSASINPKGAFFCEIAASMSMLFDDEESHAWDVNKDWWWKIPKDYTSQMEKWCPRCGMACGIQRRCSNDKIDDISPKNLERILPFSKKIKRGEYKVHELKLTPNNELEVMAKYKDTDYRNGIAKRYGIHTFVNEMGFWTPILFEDKPESYFDKLKKSQQ